MASSAPAMSNILKKLGLGHLFDKFESENITPDVVGLLSVSEMNSLGILERQDMMNLRIDVQSMACLFQLGALQVIDAGHHSLISLRR